MSASTSFVTRILLKQHQELQLHPIAGVHAAPLENNLMEWHGNVMFPPDHEYFPNLVLHFRMNFDTQYPNTGPNVRLNTTIAHSHVCGEVLCFSLVPDYREYFEATKAPKTAFWNPARTVRSFLEDFHLFLTIDQDRHRTITARDSQTAQRSADTAHCRQCGHCTATPWPSMVMDSQCCAVDEETEKSSNNENDIHAADEGSSGSSGVSLAPSLASDTLEDLRCAITGARFDEPGVVLGFGINVVEASSGNPNSRYKKTKFTISSDFEPLSYEVFTEGKITISTLGNPITHFLPFAISRVHWKRAKPVLVATIADLARSMPSQGGAGAADQLFFVLGELWKSKVVEMMQGHEHCSEKVLKGFCAIHHILLSADKDTPQVDPTAAVRILTEKAAFVREKIVAGDYPTPAQTGRFMRGVVDSLGPQMTPFAPAVSDAVRCEFSKIGWDVHRNEAIGVSSPPSPERLMAFFSRLVNLLETCGEEQDSVYTRHASTRVADFMRSPNNRTKRVIPDFGSFMPLLLLSQRKWDVVKLAFVEELLARNAMWVLRSQPSMAGRVDPQNRINKSWEPSAVGLRLTAFQVYFLSNCARWAGKEGGGGAEDENGRTLRMYERLGGRPSSAMILQFQKDAKAVQGLSGYAGFFRAVGIHVLNQNDIAGMLETAVRRSASLGYHGGGGGRGRGGGRSFRRQPRSHRPCKNI